MPSWDSIGLVGILFSIAALLVGIGIGALIVWIRMHLNRHDLIQTARRQSVELSRSTLKGKISEQLAPLLPGFPYAPSDARFLGDPVDYIVFNGYTSVKDDGLDRDSLEVVIIDIKSGGSRLSSAQCAVAEAVAAGRVRFEVIRIADDGKVSKHTYAPRHSRVR